MLAIGKTSSLSSETLRPQYSPSNMTVFGSGQERVSSNSQYGGVGALSLPPATEGLSCAGQAQGRAKSGGDGLDLRP
jgi:hypothetical protein